MMKLPPLLGSISCCSICAQTFSKSEYSATTLSVRCNTSHNHKAPFTGGRAWWWPENSMPSSHPLRFVYSMIPATPRCTPAPHWWASPLTTGHWRKRSRPQSTCALCMRSTTSCWCGSLGRHASPPLMQESITSSRCQTAQQSSVENLEWRWLPLRI